MNNDYSKYTDIDLVEFLRHHGYSDSTQWAREKRSRNYPALENIQYNDRVVVKKNINRYSGANQGETNKYRDIVDFVYNRMDSVFRSMDTEPNRVTSALNILDGYMGNPNRAAVRSQHFSENISQKFDSEQFKITPLPDYSYLTKLSFTQKTLKSEAFNGSIHHIANPIQNPESTHTHYPPNVGFPYVKDVGGEPVGYELRSDNFKGHALNSNKQEGVWISNIPKKCDFIFIVESAKDAIAHHQLTGKDNLVYCSVGGNLSKGQIETIERIAGQIAEQQNRPLKKVLGFDNDVSGTVFKLQYLLHNVNPLNSVSQTKTAVKLALVADKTSLALARELSTNYNQQSQNGDIVTLEVPKKQDVLEALVRNTLSLHRAKFINEIAIAKPRNKDHYDDLVEKKKNRISY